MARDVWRGFKQVQTFIFSTLSTVARSVKITPPISRGGRPLGKSSSMTRYSHSSAFTKGATKVFLEVMTCSRSSIRSAASMAFTLSSGRGVILSIIVQGKET